MKTEITIKDGKRFFIRHMEPLTKKEITTMEGCELRELHAFLQGPDFTKTVIMEYIGNGPAPKSAID